MDELFGAPMENIAAVLAVAFGLAVAYLPYIGLRDPILVRMAFRNVLRRPGQSLLILAGLMLATAIIIQRIHRRRLRHIQHQKHRRRFAPIRRRVASRGRGLKRLGGPCATRGFFG